MKVISKLTYIWMISLTAALGGFLFGYDWVVIGGAKPFYEVYFGVDSPGLSGWLMSSALAGCVLGAVLSGILSEKIGRRPALLIAALLFVASAIGTAMSESVTIFVLYRIVGGVGIGLAAALSPVYIAEVSPAHLRGRMVAINQLMIVIGILAAQLINLAIVEPVPVSQVTQVEFISWNVQLGWRYMFGAEVVPALLFLGLMLFVPESPRWQIKNGRLKDAEITLIRFGGLDFAKDTLAEVSQHLGEEKQSSLNFSEFSKPSLILVIVIGAVLAFYQQWSGINIIFNYAQEVFASAGFSIDDTFKSIVATGVVNLVFTFVSFLLVDSFGRRRLMMVGAAGLAIIHCLIALSYAINYSGIVVLVLILGAIATYAMTLAPVTWVLLSEIFPTRIRGYAMALCTFVLWVSSFALTFTFPFIISAFEAEGGFATYGVISIFALVFILKFVPETKGLSLEQLEKELGKRTIKGRIK